MLQCYIQSLSIRSSDMSGNMHILFYSFDTSLNKIKAIVFWHDTSEKLYMPTIIGWKLLQSICNKQTDNYVKILQNN